MDEIAFIKNVADVVEQHKEPLLQKLLTWCKLVAATNRQCADNTEHQAMHAAAVAGSLYSEIHHVLMDSHATISSVCDATVLSRCDDFYIEYDFNINTEEHTLTTIPVKVTDNSGIIHRESLKNESLEIVLSTAKCT